MAILPPAMQKALTVLSSLITCTSHFQLAESGRKRTACATSLSVISRTFCVRSDSASIFFFLPSSPIIEPYAAADWLMASRSDTTINWLRPVIGLVVQPASSTATSDHVRSMALILKRSFHEMDFQHAFA